MTNLIPIIDVHAHVTPQRYQRAIAASGSWHGLGPEVGELEWPGFRRTVSERLADMRDFGVDVQLVSPCDGFYLYDRDAYTTLMVARECNDEIAEMTTTDPEHFLGLATVPMQDVSLAIEELRRAVVDLHLRGVMIGDHVNGRTYDEAEFRPFWQAAEDLGAVVFFHQGVDNVTARRLNRYGMGNSVGNLAERILTFGALVYGGVIDSHPTLKLLFGHAGGFTAFGTARMDKATNALMPAQGRPNEWHALQGLPSDYLRSFFYDSCTYTWQTLRFLIDMVGQDRVVLGTDYPAPMILDDAVVWIRSLDCLSEEEKVAILSKNASDLLR
ncbi:MAG: amidohydrolase family protein [Candidatus Dormibacteraceae bacterium]